MGSDSWNRRQLRKLIERVGRLERVQDTDREIASGPEDWHLEDGALYIYDDDGNLRTRVGKQFDGTYTSRDRNGPIPPKPSQPEVRRRVNGLVAIWDGTFDNEDDAPPQDFRFMAVHASKDPNFTPTFETERAAIVSEDGGQAFIALPAGDDWYVALQTVTTSYRRSVKSVQTTGQPYLAHIEFEADDVYVLTADDLAVRVVTFPLSHRPTVESLVAFWGRLPVRPTDYIINYEDQTITWPLEGFEKAGQELWVHYAYTGDASPPANAPDPVIDPAAANVWVMPASADRFVTSGIDTSNCGGVTDMSTVGSVAFKNDPVFNGQHYSRTTDPAPDLPPWVPGIEVYIRWGGDKAANTSLWTGELCVGAAPTPGPPYLTVNPGSGTTQYHPGNPVTGEAASHPSRYQSVHVAGTTLLAYRCENYATSYLVSQLRAGGLQVDAGAWGYAYKGDSPVSVHREWHVAGVGVILVYPEA